MKWPAPGFWRNLWIIYRAYRIRYSPYKAARIAWAFRNATWDFGEDYDPTGKARE